jgi:exosome complex RNA-binding protein Rrp4
MNILKNGNIYIKPGNEETEIAIKKIKSLEVEKEPTYKPKVIINNVDSHLSKEEILKSLLSLNDELKDTKKTRL